MIQRAQQIRLLLILGLCPAIFIGCGGTEAPRQESTAAGPPSTPMTAPVQTPIAEMTPEPAHSPNPTVREEPPSPTSLPEPQAQESEVTETPVTADATPLDGTVEPRIENIIQRVDAIQAASTSALTVQQAEVLSASLERMVESYAAGTVAEPARINTVRTEAEALKVDMAIASRVDDPQLKQEHLNALRSRLEQLQGVISGTLEVETKD